MLVKAVLLFLAAMVVIGWVGSLFGRRTWWSRLLARTPLASRLERRPAPFCPSCGRPRIGRGPCACGRA